MDATQKKTLSAKDVLKDIKAGMSHEDLMGKYQLSPKGLQSLLKKMVGAGILDPSLLDGNKRTQGADQKGVGTPNRLSAKDVIADVKAGMSDSELMKKYKVSPKGLHNLLNKMIAAGILAQTDIDRRQSLESTVEIIPDSFPVRPKPAVQSHDSKRPVFKFLCPKCNTPHTEDYAVCPQCGIIVEKFRQKQARDKLTSEPVRSSAPDSIATDSSVKPGPEGNKAHSVEEPVAAQLIELLEIGLITDSEFGTKRDELIRQGYSFSEASTEDHVSSPQEQPTLGEPFIKPRYERAFANIEMGKPHQFNIWVLLFGSFWYCFKGMWKKGVVIFSILFTFELLLHFVLPEDPEITGMSSFLRFAKLQLIWWAPNIGLSFIGNWD
ncbi:DUF2628 domain-containing protein [Thermodesulfobacteriota bacterium]